MPAPLVPQPPNICFCGHDYNRHNAPTLTQCYDCAGGTGNAHAFSTDPPVAFNTNNKADNYQRGG